MSILVDIVLVTMIYMTFQALKLSNEEIIAGIENAGQGKLITRIVLGIGGLLFVQWAKFGAFGSAPWYGVSLLLYIVILYEGINAVGLLVNRKGCTDLMNQINQSFPVALKIPPVAEILLLAYLFVHEILAFFM